MDCRGDVGAGIAIAGLAAAGGCGEVAESPDTGGSQTGSGSAAAAGSGGVSSGTGRTGSSGGGAALAGTIAFSECAAGCGPSGSFAISAVFHDPPPCTAQTVGACTLYTCQRVATEGDDAGTLDVAGGSIPAGETIADVGNGIYSYSSVGTMFTAGDALSVSGTGGMVPAFGPESVVAPRLVTLTSPVLSGSGTTAIPTSTDLELAWTGGQRGATMTLRSGNEQSQSSLGCTWDASLGHGTVPRALLIPLAGEARAFLSYGQESSRTFRAGAYAIAETAMLYANAEVSLTP